jgi:hypothetical protein
MGVALVQSESVEGPGAEIVNSILMIAVQLGKLFGQDLNRKIFEL